MAKSIKFGVLMFAVALVFVGIMALHPYGYPTYTDMDDYYIENAQTETGSNNLVTPIVYDYRGFDTMGEALILFTAVAGIVNLFRGVYGK